MQNSGTLGELPLDGILETVQRDRATGTLHLTTEHGQATLFFLFGHLFHAIDGEREGEPVVYEALTWKDGEFTFDSKAKLPAEETIKVSTAELLAARQDGAVPAAATAPAPTKEAPKPAAVPKAAAVPKPAAAPKPPAVPEAPIEAEDEAEEAADEEEEEEEETAVEAAEEEPEEEEEEEEAEEEVPVAIPMEPEPPSTPEGAPEFVSAHPMRRATDKRPDIRPPETMSLYPVPLGKVIYESLTAGFVDFPKLLRSLGKDDHTGYVRLTGPGFSSVLLFANGDVVEGIYDAGGEVQTSENALAQFGAHIDEGEGVLDVVSLSSEMVTGLYQLLTGGSVYDGLLARFVKADALIEYLCEIGHSGALIAHNDKRSGIVIIREGQLLGAYTDASREPELDPVKVLAVCKEPATEIEVRGGEVPATLPVMTPGGPRGSAPTPPVGNGVPAGQQYGVSAETGSEDETGEENGTGDDVDWPTVINEMAGRADAVLGTRSKKVKELLYSSNHDREDVEATIEKIAELSIMFVDPSKLTALADDMRRIAAAA